MEESDSFRRSPPLTDKTLLESKPSGSIFLRFRGEEEEEEEKEGEEDVED